jgi:thioredoxin 1
MSAPNIVTLTQANFAQEVLQSKTPVLVDFWASWCGPCRMLSPILDELAQEFDGKVKIGKVNTDEQPELASQYRIQAMPTMLFFKAGQVDSQIVGFKNKRELQSKFTDISA